MAGPDVDAWLNSRKKAGEDPVDAFLRKKAAEKAVVVPDPPASSGDPTYDMFVSPEAQNAPGTVWTRGADAAKYYGEMGVLAGDSGTFGLGNRGVAYGRALADGLTGQGVDYGKRVEEQNKYLQGLKEADPQRAVAADLLGGVAGGTGLAKAGITITKPGVGWISRALRGGAEGTLQAAAQGAGQNYGTIGDKIGAAVSPGTVLSGVVGGGLPLAVSGASGAKTLFDITRGNIPEFPPSLLRAAVADRAGVSGLATKYGPEGMLPDAGPSMLRSAMGAKTTPGEGSTALETNLRAREVATPLRLREGMERSFGPDVSPRQVEAEIKGAKQAMGPEWDDAFANAKAVDTKGVAERIEAEIINRPGPAQGALEQVRSALNLRGTTELDPHPRTLHATREMIDGIVNTPGADPKVVQALTSAREMITKELHDKVPGMANLDARWAEVARRGDAYERGQEILDTGRGTFTRPAEWQAEKAEMGLPKGSDSATVQGPSAVPKYTERGTRSEVERVVNTGVDDLRALEKTFAPHNVQTQNLMQQFGAKNVEDFQNLLRNNRHFRENYQKIVHGSKTADTIESAADAERGYFAMPRFTVGGALEFAGDKLAQAQQGYGAGVRNRIADIMSKRGPELNDLIPELLKAADKQARDDITRTIVESAVRRATAGAASGRR